MLTRYQAETRGRVRQVASELARVSSGKFVELKTCKNMTKLAQESLQLANWLEVKAKELREYAGDLGYEEEK